MPKETKSAIKKAFLNLLCTTLFDNITVKDIADECGINRNTFYYNFERSGEGNPGTRPAMARKWYDYLSGVTPPPPTPSSSKTNFLILAYASGVIK